MRMCSPNWEKNSFFKTKKKLIISFTIMSLSISHLLRLDRIQYCFFDIGLHDQLKLGLVWKKKNLNHIAGLTKSKNNKGELIWHYHKRFWVSNTAICSYCHYHISNQARNSTVSFFYHLILFTFLWKLLIKSINRKKMSFVTTFSIKPLYYNLKLAKVKKNLPNGFERSPWFNDFTLHWNHGKKDDFT
jgi:hypothetical protein